MQINRILADPVGVAGLAALPAASKAAAAVLHDRSGAADLSQQLAAYHDLSGQWRGARSHGQRAALAQALTDSPFGQRVNSALNSFTRAAWAGVGAVPPQPQVQALNAFDGLSQDDQQIVATLHVDPATGTGFVSAADYRANLQSDLDAAQTGLSPRRTDTVTLSQAAQARLSGAPQAESEAPAVEPANPLLARVLAAYTKAAG